MTMVINGEGGGGGGGSNSGSGEGGWVVTVKKVNMVAGEW